MRTRIKKLKKVLAILNKPMPARKVNLLIKRPVSLKITREISDKRTFYLLQKIRSVKNEIKSLFLERDNKLEKRLSAFARDIGRLEGESSKLAELDDKIENKTEEVRIDLLSKMARGGNMNRQIRVADTDVLTRYTDINLVAGSGITLSTANDNTDKNVDITIASQVSGGVLTATGTIDDSNLDFTFTSLPSVLVINGAVYQQTSGAITWTWAAGILTATLSSAVGTGGSIFGLV